MAWKEAFSADTFFSTLWTLIWQMVHSFPNWGLSVQEEPCAESCPSWFLPTFSLLPGFCCFSQHAAVPNPEICVTDALAHPKLMLVLSVAYICHKSPSSSTSHAWEGPVWCLKVCYTRWRTTLGAVHMLPALSPGRLCLADDQEREICHWAVSDCPPAGGAAVQMSR